jgi:hypothetical protein
MNKLDYYRAVLLVVVIGVVFISGFYVFTTEDKPQEPEPVAQQVKKHGTFTVVSEYKGCDVVQWHYSMLAEYKYFLHCNNTRPVYEQ